MKIKNQKKELRYKLKFYSRLEQFKLDLLDLYKDLIIEFLSEYHEITEDQIDYVIEKSFKKDDFYQNIIKILEKIHILEYKLFELIEKHAYNSAENIKKELKELQNQQ